MPLLALCAQVLLGGQGTSTSNEGFHSVATYILRVQRRSMLPPKAEVYSIMKVSLPKLLVARYPALKRMDDAAALTGIVDEDAIDAILAAGGEDEAEMGAAGADSAVDGVRHLESLVYLHRTTVAGASPAALQAAPWARCSVRGQAWAN